MDAGPLVHSQQPLKPIFRVRPEIDQPFHMCEYGFVIRIVVMPDKVRFDIRYTYGCEWRNNRRIGVYITRAIECATHPTLR